MNRYYHVEAGAIVRGPMVRPRLWQGAMIPVNVPDDQLRPLGLWPEQIVGAPPSEWHIESAREGVIDPATQTVVTTITYTERPLDTVKAERRAAVTQLYWQHADAGVTIDPGTGSVPIKSDRTAQGEIERLLGYLSRVGGTQEFTTRAGAVLTVDLAGITAVRDAVAAHESACLTRDAALNRQIAAATTVADVMAIDIEAGWP